MMERGRGRERGREGSGVSRDTRERLSVALASPFQRERVERAETATAPVNDTAEAHTGTATVVHTRATGFRVWYTVKEYASNETVADMRGTISRANTTGMVLDEALTALPTSAHDRSVSGTGKARKFGRTAPSMWDILLPGCHMAAENLCSSRLRSLQRRRTSQRGRSWRAPTYKSDS